VRVIDFMPPRGHPPDVVRIVEGISGSVLIRSTLRLRFDYGHVVPWVRRHGDQVSYARAGDTVTVVALDRLGRSLSGIVQTVKTLGERGIVLRSLREGGRHVDLDRADGVGHLRQFGGADVDRRACGGGAGGGADSRPPGWSAPGADRGAGGDDGADADGGGVCRRHLPDLRDREVDAVPAVVDRTRDRWAGPGGGWQVHDERTRNGETMSSTAKKSRWVQIAPIGVSRRELRFLHTGTGEVIGVFQFPGFDGHLATYSAAFDGRPVIVQRIAPHAAGSTRIPIGEWTGDGAVDECDWTAVCRATSTHLQLDVQPPVERNALPPSKVDPRV